MYYNYYTIEKNTWNQYPSQRGENKKHNKAVATDRKLGGWEIFSVVMYDNE